jgi:translation initiation factor 1A
MEKKASVSSNSRKMVRGLFSSLIVNMVTGTPKTCTRSLTFLFLNLHNLMAGQEYAQVVKMLGNGRCECFCFDGVTRLGHIRGKMRKKVWITAGDIILAAKRDFQDEKVDIVHKYSADEARNLKQYGELPENARINETAVDMAMAADDADDDIGIAFDDI